MNRISPPSQEAVWHLLYRFLWPFRYFRDVTRGSLLERRQNYRYNRKMGSHLPGFMLKWVALSLLFFALGMLFEEWFEHVLPAACCYVTGTCTLAILAQIVVAWLRRRKCCLRRGCT